MLRFADKAPMGWEEFMQAAQGRVGSSDMKLLCRIEKGDYTGCAFLKEWKRFCDKADSAVNARRRVTLGKDDAFSNEEDFELAKFGDSVMSAKNPLDAELLIMKFKFDYLDRAMFIKAFSQDCVLGYALQLRILIRKDLFDVDFGNAQYTKLFDKVREEINVEK